MSRSSDVQRGQTEIQLTARIEVPCCHEQVTIAKFFNRIPVLPVTIQWSGIACPKCQRTFTIEIVYNENGDQDEDLSRSIGK